ncbi:MAG: anti-sigma factor antagonist BldG [Acidimicrobiales bacterium]
MTSDAPALRIDTATVGAEFVITLSGELDLATAPDLWAAIDPALQAGHTKILLDLTDLAFVDSTGLGVFVRAGKELRAAGGGLVLRSPGERVAKLLEITRLEEVFEIR